MLKKAKKLKPVLKFFEWAIFLLLISFSLVIISPILPIKNAPHTHVIVTGSMEPTIKAGSISLVKPIDPALVKTGDIIAFTSPSNPKDTILHRVSSISGTDPLTFKTKGDNNNNIDDWDVTASGVLGTHIFSVPYLGYAGLFVKKPLGFALVLGVPALIFIILQIFDIKKAIKDQIESEVNKRQKSTLKKVTASIIVSLFILSTGTYIVTKANYSFLVPVTGLKISVADFVPPPVPTLLTPLNNSYRNTSGLVMDWTTVSDYRNQHDPVYYLYESCADALCLVKRYQSGHLALSQIPAPGTPEGVYYWHVKACDSINNCSDWTPIWKVTVDNTDPVVKIESPSDNQYIFGSTPINVTLTDTNLSHYWLVIENSSGTVVAGPGTVTQHTSLNNQTVYTWNTTGLPEGDYVIKLEARDLAGNKQPNLAPVPADPESLTDSVDWITVHINLPPATPTGLTIFNSTGTNLGCSSHINYRSITLDWNDSTESDLSYYQLDNQTQNDFARPVVSIYSQDLADVDGEYRFRVSSVDTTGQKSPTTNWCYVTLDRMAPTTTISNPLDIGSTDIYEFTGTTLNLNYSISDANPDYTDLYYSLDMGANWTKYSQVGDTNPTGTIGFDLSTVATDSGVICFDTIGHDLAGNIETDVLPGLDSLDAFFENTYCTLFNYQAEALTTSLLTSEEPVLEETETPTPTVTPTPTETETPTPTPTPVDISVSATFDKTTNYITLNFANIPTSFGSDESDKLEYELTYKSAGLDRGLLSNIATLSHYIGSCSSGGACTPDTIDENKVIINLTGQIAGMSVNKTFEVTL